MSIQISGGGPGVADIQSGLATAAAVAAIQAELSGGAGITLFPAAAAAANGVSLAEVVRYIQEHGTDGILAALGTPVNTGGTATLAAMIGDTANSSLAARLTALATVVAGREQAVSVNAPNHIAVTVDMSSPTWRTAATHEVFTVTGVVRMRTWVECTESLTGDGSLGVGVETNTAICFGSQTLTSIDAGMLLMVAGAPATNGETAQVISDRVISSEDVGFEIVNDTALDGTLIFHCVWEPLSIGATVVAGAGGPL